MTETAEQMNEWLGMVGERVIITVERNGARLKWGGTLAYFKDFDGTLHAVMNNGFAVPTDSKGFHMALMNP